LSKMCSDKAKTWDQRSNVRSNELSTLTQAIGIIEGTVSEKTSAATVRFMQQGVSIGVAEAVATNADAMSAIEAAAEADDVPSFLQQGSSNLMAIRRLRGTQSAPFSEDGARDAIASMLKGKGEQLKSTVLVALAGQISKDPFAKIKTLIQELIERLLQEANNESNQKGWCDKATKDAKQKRGYAADEVRRLNGEMAMLEATRDQLREEIATLQTETDDITARREQAETERTEESAQNAATVEEANEGMEALDKAIQILDRFYKTVAKGSVDLSLVQQGPKADAPDAGFDNGEAYKGAQSENGGILAMLDVMRSDFTRTVSETEKAERQAQQDHLEFMTESGKSLATKSEAHKAKTEQLDNTEAALETANTDLHEQSTILQNKVRELLDLKPACIDTGMSYEDRVARREQEIASLNQASCILEKYAEYGPDGATDGC
jgi:hypothetical protein